MGPESIFVQFVPPQADQLLNKTTSLYSLSLKQLQSPSLDNIRDQGLVFFVCGFFQHFIFGKDFFQWIN